MHTLDELIAAGYSIQNAKITNVSLNTEDYGCLTLAMTLEGGGWGVVYGGYCLGKGYLGAEEFEGSAKGMEAIMRIMNTVGVSDLLKMKDKYVRVATKGLGSTVKIIGNIIDDIWFDYEAFFKENGGGAMRAKIIAVDFDGTLIEEGKWPGIGATNEKVLNYCKDEQAKGTRIILWTNRVGEPLETAIKWCEEHGLRLDAVNDNVPEVVEFFGTNTRKIYADEFIDDRMVKGFDLPYMKSKIFTHDIAAKIVELFESVLDKYDIHVPSPEDDERETDNVASLYGSTYSDLLDAVEESIVKLLKEHTEKSEVIENVFSGII